MKNGVSAHSQNNAQLMILKLR